VVSKILLALDDSMRAPRVAAAGGLLATKFGASLHPLRVIPVRAGAPTHDVVPEIQLREAAAALGEIARSLMDALVAPPRVRVGEPWRVIIELATELEADLIVLGARGHGEQALGPTAAGVLAHAAQNVFVVRDVTRRSIT
jgi:nucleotide-binding universal stress UspA family protein